MYGALALAANLGIDHVQKLLSVAGNTLNPFHEMVCFLCQDFANMVITWSSSATSATAPTRRVSFFSIASSEQLKHSNARYRRVEVIKYSEEDNF